MLHGNFSDAYGANTENLLYDPIFSRTLEDERGAIAPLLTPHGSDFHLVLS